MSDVVVKGADQLYALNRRCKQVAPELKKEIPKALRRAAKPLIADAKQSARATLPKRGGLAELVARSSYRVQVRTGAQTAGVRIVSRGTIDLSSLDRGRVRHKVFGHLPWVDQPIVARWFTKPMQAGAPKVRKDVEVAMEGIARKVAGR